MITIWFHYLELYSSQLTISVELENSLSVYLLERVGEFLVRARTCAMYCTGRMRTDFFKKISVNVYTVMVVNIPSYLYTGEYSTSCNPFIFGDFLYWSTNVMMVRGQIWLCVLFLIKNHIVYYTGGAHFTPICLELSFLSTIFSTIIMWWSNFTTIVLFVFNMVSKNSFPLICGIHSTQN